MIISDKKVIVLLGATGSGKTDFLIKLSEYLDFEIISADSRQIYKFMNIGTAKPDKKTLKLLKHHLINIINPDEKYSSANFAEVAKKLIPEIYKKKKIPILTAGTGFYIKTLFSGMFPEPPKNAEITEKLLIELKEKGNLVLYDKLKKIDPERAIKIHPNDTQRIIRALEVFYITGKKMSTIQKQNTIPYTDIKPIYFFLNPDRKKLYERINKRVDIMIAKGWINEINNLIEQGFTIDCPGFESLGYRELYNSKNLNETIEKIKQKTRNYAKRQITFFNQFQNKHYIKNLTPQNFIEELKNVSH